MPASRFLFIEQDPNPSDVGLPRNRPTSIRYTCRVLPEASIPAAVLFGAGASAFANIPTVHAFFNRVDWSPPRGFEAACEELARRISILEKNDECRTWPKFDAEKVFGWLELWERNLAIDRSRATIEVSNLAGQVRIDDVISHLRKEIVRIYGSPIDWEFLAKAPHWSLIELLDGLTPPSEPLQLFTTNYDPILEQIFGEQNTRLFLSGRTLRTCTGFSEGRPGRWRPELFNTRPVSGERLIHVVKLHGSASWKMETSEPVETGWATPTDHDCLLYFGYKSIPEREPFVTLHRILKSVLLKCGAVIAIGFRFADPYIRELFDLALLANQRLRLICALTRNPEPNSPVSVMMDRFPGRVLLLADAEGNPIPFGHPDFGQILESTLWDQRQGEAVA
jgi:hypothetical protein